MLTAFLDAYTKLHYLLPHHTQHKTKILRAVKYYNVLIIYRIIITQVHEKIWNFQLE